MAAGTGNRKLPPSAGGLRCLLLVSIFLLATSGHSHPLPHYDPHFLRFPGVEGTLFDEYGCSTPFLLGSKVSANLEVVAHLRTGGTASGISRLCRENRDDPMSLRLNGAVYHPEDTRFIVVNGHNGTPFGPDWIFKVVNGRISAYHILPGKGLNWWDFLVGRKTGEWIFLEQDAMGPDNYSDGLLEHMVRDHAEAAGYMSRKKGGRYLAMGLGVAAAALFVTASLTPGEDVKTETGFVTRTTYRMQGYFILAGIGAGVTGLTSWLLTRNNHIDAVSAYNRAEPGRDRP